MSKRKRREPINSGRVTIDGVELHYSDGEPLRAGDIEPGATVKFDPFTGEIFKIEPPEKT